MKRRRFLKLLGVGSVGLAVDRLEAKVNKLKSPLVSKPDGSGSKKLSKKAQKLAEYVITEGKKKGVKEYSLKNVNEKGHKAQKAKAYIEINDHTYIVTVVNHDDLKKSPADDLRIMVWEGEDLQNHLADRGLNGCDWCSYFDDDGKLKSPSNAFYGESYKFNEQYEKTLDTLIEFYEK